MKLFGLISLTVGLCEAEVVLYCCRHLHLHLLIHFVSKPIFEFVNCEHYSHYKQQNENYPEKGSPRAMNHSYIR